ncbi:MAG: GNAT family N-acetyltransferase [Porphyromonas sp.]|nr:GNAT family N-acetyltransferase [Porphyromonas sp.]
MPLESLSAEEILSLVRAYIDFFPRRERRTFESIAKRQHNISVYKEDGNIVAVLMAYSLSESFYIEYLLVMPEHQGKGIGTKILKDLMDEYQDKDIILECEHPEEGENAVRRIKLYRSLGFELEDIPYLQPPYRQGDAPTPLLLMRKRCSDIPIGSIISELYAVVYNISDFESYGKDL